MDPITFILWMYLSWGITRMFFRGDDNAAPEVAAPAEAGPRPAPAADEPAARRSLWERIRDNLDGQADDVRRERDWSNLGWWLKGLLGAAWTPIRDVRQAKKWTDDKREERRRRREEADDETPRPDAEGEQPEEEPEGRRWQDRRDEDPDVEHDRDEHDEEQPRRRRRWWNHNEPDPQPTDTPDIEVEQVPRYGPRHPELDRPIRALEPPGDSAPEVEVEVEVVPVPEPEPEHQPALAQVIPMSRIERTPPVTSGTLATTQGGQVAAVGDLPSHSMALTAADAIVQANVVCVDHMAATIAILNREIQVVAAKIDSLQANGITGSVLGKWADVMAQLQVARTNARTAQAQIAEAHGLSAAARAHQASVGNPIQEAVVAAGEPNSANATRYYGDV